MNSEYVDGVAPRHALTAPSAIPRDVQHRADPAGRFADRMATFDSMRATAIGAGPNVKVTERLGCPFSSRWEAIDLNTHDHEPGARMHIVGRGATPREAVKDLLAQLSTTTTPQE